MPAVLGSSFRSQWEDLVQGRQLPTVFDYSTTTVLLYSLMAGILGYLKQVALFERLLRCSHLSTDHLSPRSYENNHARIPMPYKCLSTWARKC